ncbi:glycosyltransferase family A protein [Brevundimonas sp.]|uniref:glycosyltransferase family A protein n=1 Tax=Brevundimonas sp. TaxID=1871086 RepID=UPI0035AE35EC
MSRARFCVCVPARNEAARLPVLLEALAAQDLGHRTPVFLWVNDTPSADATEERLRLARTSFADRLDLRWRIDAEASTVPHAGAARKAVMDWGAAELGPDGVLISTDADTRPPPDWVRLTLEALDGPADVIGGRLARDDRDPGDEALERQARLWDDYWTAVRAIEDALDPRAWDPPPRHGDHTGASLAMTAATYEAAGGVPLLPTGEDRALVDAARAAGALLAHPPDVWTRVSVRLTGRAAGGMADELVRRKAAAGLPIMAPSLDHWRRRALWRRRTRGASGDDRRVAIEERDLPTLPCDMNLAGWASSAGREAA